MNGKELKAFMIRHDDTQEKLAEALGISASGLCERIKGNIEFRRSEINIIRQRYKLSVDDFIRIFFDE